MPYRIVTSDNFTSFPKQHVNLQMPSKCNHVNRLCYLTEYSFNAPNNASWKLCVCLHFCENRSQKFFFLIRMIVVESTNHCQVVTCPFTVSYNAMDPRFAGLGLRLSCLLDI